MLSKRILVLMFVVAFLLLVGCGPPTTVPNQTPILTSSPVTTATVGVLYTYDVNAKDPDGDTLIYSLAVKPTNMTINSATGLIKWTPVAAQIGDNSVTVKVSDGTLSITQSFKIKVGTLPAVNKAPVIISTPVTTATVGLTYFYGVNATDPNNDILTYSLTTCPPGMTISSANGLIMWTPIAEGAYAVVVNVSDGALSDTQGFTVVVSKPTVPVETYTITASAGTGGTISPLGDVTLVKGSDKLFTIIPDTGYSIEKVLIDGSSVGVVNTYTFNDVTKDHAIHATFITISEPPAVNQAPTITSTPITIAVMGVTYSYDVDATDPDGDTLTYSLTTKPVGMSIGSTTGVISWIPTAEGSYGVTVEASDGVLSDTQSFTITVSTVEIIKIEVDPKTMTLFEGGSETIKSVTATYEIKGFEAPIALGDCTYLSSDDTVATVLVGVVTAVVEGSATIYVNYAGETDAIEVTVLEPLDEPVHNITKDIYYTTIQGAIVDADHGNTIEVAAGTYYEVGQIVIDKNLTIIGADKVTTIIKPNLDTTVAYYVQSDAWIYVSSGITFALSEVTLDGTDLAGTPRIIRHAIQSRGELTVEDCIIKNIKAGTYYGRGIVLLSGTSNTIARCEFSDIQRIGIHVRGSIESTNPIVLIEDCTYVGKGDGDWLDYGIEFGGGGSGTVDGCDISACTGVASTDGSISAGVLATDYFGLDTLAAVENSTFTGNSHGIYVGYGENDETVLTAHYNNFSGNDYGITNDGVIVVDATYNWWGSELGPKYEGFPALGGDAVSANVDYSNWSASSN